MAREHDKELGVLTVRTIEAEILKQVYEVLIDRFGKEEAKDVIRDTALRAAIRQGQAMAAEVDGEPGLKDFADTMPNWTRGGALEVDIVEQTPERLRFNVTRCRFAEMYHAMGMGELGGLMSCNRDGQLCKGFNPKIKFTRTRTIMAGDSHCDFCLELPAEEAGAERG